MSDFTWNDLFNNTSLEENKQDIKVPTSILDSIPTFTQPVIANPQTTTVPHITQQTTTVDFNDLFNSGVTKPVVQAPIPQITFEQPLTEQTDDDVEDEFSHLEDDGEEIDDELEDDTIPVTKVTPFSLMLPENKPQSSGVDLSSLMQTSVNVQPMKRGPGRPRKETATVEEIVSKLPVTIESEQDKSTNKNDIETLSSSTIKSKETITTEIPKKEILEIANSLQRISESLIRIGKS